MTDATDVLPEIPALARSLPRLTIDPFDPKILIDPFGFYEHLRELGDLFWVEKYGHYGTARYEHVHHILNTWQDFTATRGVGMSDITKPGSWREQGALVETDPPVHTNIRSAMQRIMSPPRIRGWRTYLEGAAAELLDEVLPGGDVDVVPDLAEAFVMKALPTMLGTDADRPNLITIGNHNFNAIGPKNDIFMDSFQKVEEISAWYEEAASAGAMAPGGLGEEFFQAEQEGKFEPGMAYKIVRMLLRGGFDTTISGIGTTIMYLAQNPDAYRKIQEEPKLAIKAFEEALRLQSPAQSLFRTTNEGRRLAGVDLEPGVKVQYWLAAGNRDRRYWGDDADAFDVTRDVTGTLAFGGGVHKCIGIMVARIEAETFLEAFIKRVKSMELTGEPRFRLSNSLRALDTLPVRFHLH